MKKIIAGLLLISLISPSFSKSRASKSRSSARKSYSRQASKKEVRKQQIPKKYEPRKSVAKNQERKVVNKEKPVLYNTTINRTVQVVQQKRSGFLSGVISGVGGYWLYDHFFGNKESDHTIDCERDFDKLTDELKTEYCKDYKGNRP